MQLQKLHTVGKRILLVAFVALIHAASLSAQPRNRNIESLAMLALELDEELVLSDVSQIKFLIEQFVQHEELQNNAFIRGVIDRLAGTYYEKSSKLKTALDYHIKALKYFLSVEDFSLSSRIANDAGNVCQLLGFLERADHYYLMSKMLAERSKNDEDRYISLYNRGRLKLLEGDTSLALSLFEDYELKADELGKYVSLSDVNSMYYMIAANRSQKESALNYLNKAIEYADRSDSRLAKSNAAINKAIYAVEIGQMDSALILFHTGLDYRKSMHNQHLICEAYYNIGYYYQLIENDDSARFYFDRSIELALDNDLYIDGIDGVEAMLSLDLSDEERKLYKNQLNDLRKALLSNDDLALVSIEERSDVNESAEVGGDMLNLIYAATFVGFLIWFFVSDRKGIN